MARGRFEIKRERSMEAYLDLIDAATTVDALVSRPLIHNKVTLGQFRVLSTLLETGPQTQQALFERHFRTEANASSTLAILERRGLIVRRGHEADKRQRMVHLSPQGHAFIAKLMPKQTRVVRAQMAALNGREQNTLRKLCQKLIEGNPTRFIAELTLAEREEETPKDW